MRQQYETSDDRKEEDDIMKEVCQRMGWLYEKLDKTERIDYRITRLGYFIGVAEVKRRHIMPNQYTDIMLSAAKLQAGLRMAIVRGGRFLFIIKLDDNNIYVAVPDTVEKLSMFEYRYGGRTAQTRDKWDVEVVVHIPWKLFSKIEGRPNDAR